MQGITSDGQVHSLRIMPHESEAANPAFDITPARLVTSIITEVGVFDPAQISEMNTSNTIPAS
jgi:methylthioribose-1-phosphate isomerase